MPANVQFSGVVKTAAGWQVVIESAPTGRFYPSETDAASDLLNALCELRRMRAHAGIIAAALEAQRIADATARAVEREAA